MDELWWRLKQYWAWIAAAVAALLAWFAGFELITHFLHSQNAISIAANLYVVFLCALMVFGGAYRQWITIRKERYANVTPIIHRMFHEVRDFQTFVLSKEPHGGTREQYTQFQNQGRIIVGRILDQLGAVMMMITGTRCRTAIKMMYRKDRLYVYTLTRDQISKDRYWRLDNKRVQQDHDPLDQNFQFARLFNDTEEVWHFCSQNLLKEPNFSSTSETAYEPDAAARFRKKWVLPYKSTITCVIRQGQFDLCPDIGSDVLGFLTVDSDSRGVFLERWDSEIVFSLADTLYHPLRAFSDALNRGQNAGHEGTIRRISR